MQRQGQDQREGQRARQREGKERWEIDSAHSRLRFSLRHIVISEIHGCFHSWGGEMLLDPADLAGAEIQVWIDVTSIDTESVERDAHLRSPEFLNAPRFPRAQFTSTEVALRAAGEAALTGRLQLHGVTRSVSLDVVAQRTWLDDQGSLRATYRVTGSLDRQLFGLHWNQDLDFGGIVVGDQVELEARVELVRTGYAEFARGEPAGEEGATASPT
jgi:polyisoprenoid-binding protein YceI